MTKHTAKSPAFQLNLPGFNPAIPGYPARGIMRCLALCAIYGWPNLGSLANRQLARLLEGGQP